MAKTSYRATFSGAENAEKYDEVVYAPNSSADILWQVEAPILRSEAVAAVAGKAKATYLDFACGTGRVTSLLEDICGSSTGIDVSRYMIERARTRCHHTQFICQDITDPNTEIEIQYDLITSFRFLTNAEPDLRRQALAALHRRLKDDGVLIINTHSNPWSYRALLLPYHWLKDRLRSRPLYGYLSNREARRLLEASGFRVKKVLGMGFVPQKVLGAFPVRAAMFLERKLAARRLLQTFGLNQMFICTKA
jgi:SAM-dependent methyltransferase